MNTMETFIIIMTHMLFFSLGWKMSYDINFKHSENTKSASDDVSGISTDFEKDLFTLVNKYASAGLSKPHLVKRLEWVLGSCKKS